MTQDMCKHYRQLYDHKSDRQVSRKAVTILGSGVEIQGDPINLVVDIHKNNEEDSCRFG